MERSEENRLPQAGRDLILNPAPGTPGGETLVSPTDSGGGSQTARVGEPVVSQAGLVVATGGFGFGSGGQDPGRTMEDANSDVFRRSSLIKRSPVRRGSAPDLFKASVTTGKRKKKEDESEEEADDVGAFILHMLQKEAKLLEKLVRENPNTKREMKEAIARLQTITKKIVEDGTAENTAKKRKNVESTMKADEKMVYQKTQLESKETKSMATQTMREFNRNKELLEEEIRKPQRKYSASGTEHRAQSTVEAGSQTEEAEATLPSRLILPKGAVLTLEYPSGSEVIPTPRDARRASRSQGKAATTTLETPTPTPGTSYSQALTGDGFTVVKKGKKKPPTPKPTPTVTNASHPLERTKGTRSPGTPRLPSIITLAVTGPDNSYTDLLRRVKTTLQPGKTTVTALRKGKSGELEICLKQGEAVSDLKRVLSEKMPELTVLDRTRKALVHLKDLDELVTREEIVGALSQAAECSKEDLVVTSLRPAFSGTQNATVRMPVAVARKITTAGRVLVGPISCRVRIREPDQKCYKCWETGHKAEGCQGLDKSKLCYKCEGEGHKSRECPQKGQQRDRRISPTRNTADG